MITNSSFDESDLDNSTFIPEFLEDIVQLVVPGDCYYEFFRDYNFLNGHCLKLTLSKLLGYSIVVGSSIVKLPQVYKILKAKSGDGVSLMANTLELLAISITWAYSFGHEFPFSTYGEAIFLAIQTLCIAVMVLFFGGKAIQGVAYMSIYVGLMAFGLSPAAPNELLATLQGGSIVLVVGSKMFQIVASFRAGNTGQLSFITQFLLFVGGAIRVFTTIQETQDALVLSNYALSSGMNGIIVGQIIYYWKKQPHDIDETKDEIKEEMKGEETKLTKPAETKKNSAAGPDGPEDIPTTSSSPTLYTPWIPHSSARDAASATQVTQRRAFR